MSGPVLCVYGIIEADNEYKLKVAAWEACKKANIDPPEELVKFFNYDVPDSEGMLVRIVCDSDFDRYGREPKELPAGIKEFKAEMCNGMDIDLTKLDKRFKKLRIYNSY